MPVRQWVLSLPYRVRTLCVYDADACAVVRGVLQPVFGAVVHCRLAALEPVPRGMSFTNGITVQMPE